jgi:hypothetical protein
MVSGSCALPPRWPPQCSCVVIESSFDPSERLQAPGSLWYFNYNCKDSVEWKQIKKYKFIIYNTLQIIYIPGYIMSHSWLLFGHCGTEFLLRKIIWSMQDDDSLLRSFVTIKPAAEKILSDRTNVDGTAKYRRARTESLEYLSELSFNSSIL